MVRVLVIIFIILLTAALAFFFYVDSLIPKSEAIDHAIDALSENEQIVHQIGKVKGSQYRVDEMPASEDDSVEVNFELHGEKDSVGVEAILIRQKGEWRLKKYHLTDR